jgi:hypothetical protein
VGELLTFASDTRKDFAHWLKSLPPELQINVDVPQCTYLPHVLQLQYVQPSSPPHPSSHSLTQTQPLTPSCNSMQFHVLSIFLHRPFFSRHLLRASALSPSVQTPSPSTHPRTLCTSAAHSLIRVLHLYRTQHSLRQTNVQIVHLVFTAALVHVYSACTPTNTTIGADQAMQDLQFCIQALSEMSATWRNATRALEVIICVKREWMGKAAAYRAKRPSDHGEGEGNGGEEGQGHRRRRQRTLHPVELPQQNTGSEAADTTAGESLVSGYDVRDAWHFLNGTDLNFGGGDETFGGGGAGADGVGAVSEEEVLLMMDGFGDVDGDDLFGVAMLGNPNGWFGPGGGMGTGVL